MIKSLLLVGIGGFAGSIARYGVYLFMQQRWPVSFPWGTFSANILGCFLIGLLAGWSLKGAIDEPFRLLLIVGFCGGFTTFSTFSMDSLGLLQSGSYGQFFSYALGSLVLGLLATLAGLALVR